MPAYSSSRILAGSAMLCTKPAAGSADFRGSHARIYPPDVWWLRWKAHLSVL